MIKHLINDFIETLDNGEINLYNEAGLQHELGYFLRKKEIKLKFEYNIGNLNLNISNPLKKEIDLFIEHEDQRYLIELKFPNKGAFPRRMTQSILDIFFIQQLVNNGFKNGYFIFFSELDSFTKGKNEDKIYSYFRGAKLINEFDIEDIPGFMLKEGKGLYSILKTNEIKFKKDLRINFSELNCNGKRYNYFVLEI